MSINNPPMGYTHMPSSAYDSTLYPAKFPMTYHPASYLFSHCVFRTGSELVPDFPDWRSDLHQEKTGQQNGAPLRTGSGLSALAPDFSGLLGIRKNDRNYQDVFSGSGPGFRTGSGLLYYFPDRSVCFRTAHTGCLTGMSLSSYAPSLSSYAPKFKPSCSQVSQV